MCEVLDRIENRGIEKGKGIEKRDMLQKLIQSFPIEQVAKCLDMTVDEINLALKA